MPILATGKGWLVVDKPYDMSVHNDPGNDLCSVIASYIGQNESLQRQLAYDCGYGVHAPHRLDKHTSGVILVACRCDVFRDISFQFEERRTRKRYIALLHGNLEPIGDDTTAREWKWPLSRQAGGRLNPQGDGLMLSCETRYRLLASSPHYCLAECVPVTGRSHQIRRHAKLAGHPVVGDRRYGSSRAIAFLKQHLGFDRLALHSMAITFQPPDTRQPVTVISPQIPEPMQALLNGDR